MIVEDYMDTQGQANVESGAELGLSMNLHRQLKDSHPEMCGECGNENILTDLENGEYVCGQCGLVVGEIVNYGPEWRAFDLEQKEKRTRTGAPLTERFHDKGMSTVIDYSNRDHAGRKLTQEQRERSYRLRKWNKRSKVDGARERNLAHSLSIIDGYCDKLHLGKIVVERSDMLYKVVLNEGYVRGRSIRNMTAACVYTIIREDRKLKRPLKEFCKALGMSKEEKKAVAKSYRFINKMSKENKDLRKLMPKIDKVSDVVDGLANNMELLLYIQRMSIGIARYIEKPEHRGRYTAGRDPYGMSVGVLYLSSLLARSDKMPKEKRTYLTQKMIADSASITEVTLRNRMRGLEKEFLKDFGIDGGDWKGIADVVGTIVDWHISKKNNGMGVPYEKLKRECGGYVLDEYLHFLEETSIIKSVGGQDITLYKPNFAIA